MCFAGGFRSLICNPINVPTVVQSLSSDNKLTRTLLLAGSLGYVTAFLAWFQWLLFVIYGNIQALRGIYMNDFTTVIYVPYLPYHYALALILPFSFAFSGLGWIGINRISKSRTALAAGVSSAVLSGLFAYSAIQILVFADTLQYFLRPIFIFAGIIFWGSAVLKARTQFKHQNLAYMAGVFFVATGIVSISIVLPLVLFYGLEYWFALLGWLYAFATLVTAHSFLRLARK